jgi:hypothetical protein
MLLCLNKMCARIISVNGAETGNHHGLSRILPFFLCAEIVHYYNIITGYVYVISSRGGGSGRETI